MPPAPEHQHPDAAAGSAAASHGEAVAALDGLTRRLRADCPWDREQDERSIVPHTLEEAYELADAVQSGDDARLVDELGDVLFQVHFLGLLLEERGAGSLGEIADHVRAKLVRRHPHVFAPGTPEAEAAAAPTGPGGPAPGGGGSSSGSSGSAMAPTSAGAVAGAGGGGGGSASGPSRSAMAATSTAPDVRDGDPPAAPAPSSSDDALPPRDAEGVLRQWDAVKATEAGREQGIFGEVPENLPALLHARKVQRRATSSGLPPAEREALLEVAREGVDALGAATAAGDRRATMDALGDLLFAVVGVARDAKADPEIALRSSSARFRRRVEAAEAAVVADGGDWASLDDGARLARYAEAARRERPA